MTPPTDSGPAAQASRTGIGRLAVIWGGLFALALVINVQTILSDAAAQGRSIAPWRPWLEEGTSIILWIGLVPLFYRLHRRFPLAGGWRAAAVHLLATVPISLIHVYGMFALRIAANDWVGGTYGWPDGDALLYEWRKDVVTYILLSGVLLSVDYLLGRTAAASTAIPAPPPSPAQAPAQAPAAPGAGSDIPALEEGAAPAAGPPARAPLDRFAVRRKGVEVMVSAADIAWIEAAGNYAVLHLGAERFEIRSSLTRLEAELDPARFVRTHKSSIVNLSRVRRVEPWVNGDYRIVLDDGAVLNLSRRYRSRFESVVPVKT